MEYAEAVAWLYDRQKLGMKLGLEKMDRLLRALGDPQVKLKVVHVAGTNGKGSVIAFLDAILREAGFTVGATTSPHLVSFCERFRINGAPATRDQVAAAATKLRPHVEALDAEENPPTFFECVTAMSLDLFAEAGVAWALVETGMGGRLDATNVLMPELTIITQIGMDHEQFLGDTIGDVAWEKAGIMKPNVPLVTSAEGTALTLLKARSQELQVPMSIIGDDYLVRSDGNTMTLNRPNGAAQYHVGLAGAHQGLNAAVAVAACDALTRQGVLILPRAIQHGLANATHPCRMETYDYDGMEVLIDGAHNLDAAKALAAHLQELGWSDAAFIIGFAQDKPWNDMWATWAPFAGNQYVVPLRNPRTADPQAIANEIGGKPISDVQKALNAARENGAKRVVVAGSLFLAGEARAVMLGLPVEEIRGSQ